MAVKKVKDFFVNGFFVENPFFIFGVGLCPLVGATFSFDVALALAFVVWVTTIFTAFLLISLSKAINFLNKKLVTVLSLGFLVSVFIVFGKLYFPELTDKTGIWLPLVTVNCFLITKANYYFGNKMPSKNRLKSGLANTVSGLLVYSFFLIGIAFLRQLSGEGSFGNFRFLPQGFSFFLLPAGGFLSSGFLLAFMNYLQKTKITEPKVETFHKK
ncbi:hypothetical protein IT568_11485 [bacterium]|nr:hypothetical protein [bacterium]